MLRFVPLAPRLITPLALAGTLSALGACRHRPPEPFAVAAAPRTPVGDGTLLSLGTVSSVHLDARRVDIWLPPAYDGSGRTRYGVLYMHDGQNLFDAASAYGGSEWQVDETLGRLIRAGTVAPTIVVGIWNTARRRDEYMPQQAMRAPQASANVGGVLLHRDSLRSDAYLRFLVEELKPRVDRTFPTRTDRAHTTIMGSSMGGLISCYAIARYPRTFGGAGCISTHWPAGDGVVVDWLGAHLPERRTHRIWFDHGTATLDSLYAPHQQRMDALMTRARWTRGVHWESRVYPGAEHNERAWAARLEEPLRFLLRR